MQDDIDIAMKANEHRIPTLFVRSKSDDVCLYYNHVYISLLCQLSQ
jgi:hypothetical protein